MKTLGTIAYDAYCKTTGGKSLITGDILPEYEKLKPEIQDAWEKAGQAVAISVGREEYVTGFTE